MNQGLVSVVLPIYNVEQYLDRCINSVVNQTYKNLEIILVDDGSPDNCPQMCNDWAKKDSRIKVIHKKNGGLGYARNTGIDNATGEYICFIDSDDYISLNTIEKTYSVAKAFNADLVSYGYKSINGSGKLISVSIPHTSKDFYSNEEIISYILPNMIAPDTATGEITNLWMSMCGALFKKNLFDRTGWRMVSERDIISEDVYSLLRLYKSIQSVAVISEAFYYYCENGSSLTHTYKSDRFQRINYFYRKCIEACDEDGYSEEVKQRLIYPYVSNTMAALKMIVKSDLSKEEQKKLFDSIILDNQLQAALQKANIKKESFARKTFIKAVKARKPELCYLMIKAKA